MTCNDSLLMSQPDLYYLDCLSTWCLSPLYGSLDLIGPDRPHVDLSIG